MEVKEKEIVTTDDWEQLHQKLIPKKERIGDIQIIVKLNDRKIGVVWEINKVTSKNKYYLKALLVEKDEIGWKFITNDEKLTFLKKGQITYLADNVKQIIEVLKKQDKVIYMGEK